MDNYKYTFGRWGIDKDWFLTDMQTGEHCVGKVYDMPSGEYKNEQPTELKLPDNIDGFYVENLSGEIWIQNETTFSRYATISLKYFGEANSDEHELYASLVNKAFFGNEEAAIELEKNLAKVFYLESKVNERIHKQTDFGETCYWISNFIPDRNLSFKFLQLGAFKGNRECQYSLSWYYIYGYDHEFKIEKNTKLAIEWLKKAAERKCTQAMAELSSLYSWRARACERDLRKSFYWTKKAVESGYIWLYERLVDFYESGIGCAKNYKKAFYWSKKIYKLPEKRKRNCCMCPAEILYRIGYYFFYGLGVKKDLQSAYDFFSKSATEGYALAFTALAYFYSNGIIVEKNPGKAEEMMLKKDEAIKTNLRKIIMRQGKLVIASKEAKRIEDNIALILDNYMLDNFRSYWCYHSEKGQNALWLKEIAISENIRILEDDILAKYIFEKDVETLEKLVKCWMNKTGFEPESDDLFQIIQAIRQSDESFDDFIMSYL